MNGWSSRETWLMVLWFDMESLEDVTNAKGHFYETLDSLPDFMRDFVDEKAINWKELEEHFREDRDGH